MEVVELVLLVVESEEGLVEMMVEVATLVLLMELVLEEEDKDDGVLVGVVVKVQRLVELVLGLEEKEVMVLELEKLMFLEVGPEEEG